MDNKKITFAIPCYNSAAYMDTCLSSIMASKREDIEVIIVDDGSTEDDTAAKADAWAAHFPGIVRVIHQENGGHGAAVNAGLASARGLYFKVVDSDDWIDVDAFAQVMDYIDLQAKRERPTDLIVANFVYEKVYEGKYKVMRLANIFPVGREFTWHDVGTSTPFQYLHMHELIYRTELLRQTGLMLPEHCFYVDNLYAYMPLPSVKTIYYLDVNFYRYFIGRKGQSVGEDAMMANIDQHITVTYAMVDAVKLPDAAPADQLLRIMRNHMSLMMCTCAVFLRKRNLFADDRKLQDIWDYLHEHNPGLFYLVKRHPLVIASNIPTKAGRAATLEGYRIAQRIYNFN